MKSQKKLIDLNISEPLLSLSLKNGNQQEILISDVVKIHIEINKRKIFRYIPLFSLPAFLLLFSLNEYTLVIMIIIYLYLIIYLFNKLILKEFKFKLIVQKLNLEKLEFNFKKDLKYKIVDIIYLIRKTNKPIL